MWYKRGENISNEVHNNMCDGNCSRCGECCGLFVPFTDDELETIKKYVKLHNIQPYNRIDILTGSFKAHCCFYNEAEKKCMIYPVRPYVCRDFRCDRPDWKKYRDKYELKGKYNSSLKKTIIATFDDMVYNDYTPIIRYLLSLLPISEEGVREEDVVALFRSVNRLDLFKQFSVTNENGEKLSGEELLKRNEK